MAPFFRIFNSVKTKIQFCSWSEVILISQAEYCRRLPFGTMAQVEEPGKSKISFFFSAPLTRAKRKFLPFRCHVHKAPQGGVFIRIVWVEAQPNRFRFIFWVEPLLLCEQGQRELTWVGRWRQKWSKRNVEFLGGEMASRTKCPIQLWYPSSWYFWLIWGEDPEFSLDSPMH